MATVMEATPAQPGSGRPSPRRRFRLLDGMILVAATAAGLALTGLIQADGGLQGYWALIVSDIGDLMQNRDPVRLGAKVFDLGFDLIMICAPMVAMWGIALIPIRVSGARPRWRRLVRQPGMMAVCASTLAVGLIGLFCVFKRLVASDILLFSNWMLVESVLLIGVAVAASWMTLILGGRLRAEASWIDRLGRAIGFFWILSGLGLELILVFD